MENALSKLMMLAGLALMVGAGVLAVRISNTWTDANTQALVNGITIVCGGAGVLAALVIAIFIGIPMGRRMEERREERRPVRVSIPQAPPDWDVPPPMLTARKDDGGTWQSGGPANYNLWDDEPQEWGDIPRRAI